MLFICDIQTKFRTAIHSFPLILATTQKLLRFAEITKTPVLATTQQRSKLGGTCEELELDGRYKSLVKADVDKTRFSMCVPEVLTALDGLGEKRDVIIVGIETHICVLQTSIDLLARGYRVYIPADGVSSCNPEERGVALARLRHEGVKVSSSESLMYEIMEDASKEEFRALAALVKESKEKTKEAVGVLCRF